MGDKDWREGESIRQRKERVVHGEKRMCATQEGGGKGEGRGGEGRGVCDTGRGRGGERVCDTGREESEGVCRAGEVCACVEKRREKEGVYI